MPIERTTDFQEGGTLRADVLNDELDKQTAFIQQIADNINRSMILPPYATTSSLNLTLPYPEAGKTVVWNNDGTNLENSAVAVNDLENTLREYKEQAAASSSSAAAQATLATEQSTLATQKATEATESAAAATAACDIINTTMATKANIAMDNLSQAGKHTIANLSSPSINILSITLPAANSIISAPGTGYLLLSGKTTASGGSVAIRNNSAGFLCDTCFWPSTGSTVFAFVPAQTGQEIFIGYSNVTSLTLQMIYIQGAL